MSNHFHMLIEVPKRPEILPTSEDLVNIVRGSLGNKKADALAEELARTLEFHGLDTVEKVKEKYFVNMWNVSTFMKIVKQRFSQWYNMKNGRKGTLWEERFKSVLIQGESHALKSIAAYIDLNPVRAGITDDPKDYRWSGYGEAVGAIGRNKASKALEYLTSLSAIGGIKGEEERPATYKKTLAMWRRYLFGLPEDEELANRHMKEQKERAQKARKEGYSMELGEELTLRKRISKEKVLEVLKEQGELSLIDLCSCKVRYFIDGTALGTKSFIEEIFRENRSCFGFTRKECARAVKGVKPENGIEPLCNMRDLRKSVFG